MLPHYLGTGRVSRWDGRTRWRSSAGEVEAGAAPSTMLSIEVDGGGRPSGPERGHVGLAAPLAPASVTPAATELGAGASRQEPVVRLSSAEIERIIGARLPDSVRRHRPRWANERAGSHVYAPAWMGAGRRTANVDLNARTVHFVPWRGSNRRLFRRGLFFKRPAGRWALRSCAGRPRHGRGPSVGWVCRRRLCHRGGCLRTAPGHS